MKHTGSWSRMLEVEREERRGWRWSAVVRMVKQEVAGKVSPL